MNRAIEHTYGHVVLLRPVASYVSQMRLTAEDDSLPPSTKETLRLLNLVDFLDGQYNAFIPTVNGASTRWYSEERPVCVAMINASCTPTQAWVPAKPLSKPTVLECLRLGGFGADDAAHSNWRREDFEVRYAFAASPSDSGGPLLAWAGDALAGEPSSR